VRFSDGFSDQTFESQFLDLFETFRALLCATNPGRVSIHWPLHSLGHSNSLRHQDL
jgi:hypothetical protein